MSRRNRISWQIRKPTRVARGYPCQDGLPSEQDAADREDREQPAAGNQHLSYLMHGVRVLA